MKQAVVSVSLNDLGGEKQRYATCLLYQSRLLYEAPRVDRMPI